VFKEKYGFSTNTVGLAYIGLMVGFAAGVALSATVMDRIAMGRSSAERSGGQGHKPENRLVPIVYASPLIPAGLLLYGWSLQAGLHFVVPIVGSALVGTGMVLTMVCFVFVCQKSCIFTRTFSFSHSPSLSSHLYLHIYKHIFVYPSQPRPHPGLPNPTFETRISGKS
jgi:hypothetical protein